MSSQMVMDVRDWTDLKRRVSTTVARDRKACFALSVGVAVLIAVTELHY